MCGSKMLRHSGMLGIALLLMVPCLEAAEIHLGTGIIDNPPYLYGTDSIRDDYPGITIDILRLIEKKSDIKFKITRMPWARVVDAVQDNKLDGGFHFSYTNKRKNIISYPIIKGKTLPNPRYSISRRSYFMYKLKGSAISWNGKKVIMDSKNDDMIGAVRGESIVEIMNESGNKLYEVNNNEQLVSMLFEKRISAFVGLENILDHKIATLPPKDRVRIEKVFPPIVIQDYYLVFSKEFHKKYPKVAWKIWKEIEKMKTSGELKTIIKKYADLKEME